MGKNNEPKLRENQVIASADIGSTNIEIVCAAEIYVPVMR